MTPTAAPTAAQQALLSAAALAVVAVGLLVLLAVLVSDAQGIRGALVGGGAVVAVVVFGAASLTVVARVAPTMNLLVAMTTYVTQVAVLMALFVAYQRRPELQRDWDAGWLAGGIVAATVAWTAGYVIAGFRETGPQREGDAR